MTNKFYDPGPRRAARVGDLFAAIAHRYDLINDLQSFGLHRYWKRQLTAMARPQSGARALDLCCGTGDVTFALARRGVEAIGLDFSEPMLAVAESRLKLQSSRFKVQGSKSNARSVQFLQGNALKTPFPDDSFDIVTVSYGLRNLAGWEDGLREMQRVARPGGRLLV
ncbi:MAG TPA: class I SAM-dependent methyltransferase, partial [Verrucomicrobiae bacterium]|nr:class I SAM-dependent methyltransferase [Verrucomicrobiae bacterium]